MKSRRVKRWNLSFSLDFTLFEECARQLRFLCYTWVLYLRITQRFWWTTKGRREKAFHFRSSPAFDHLALKILYILADWLSAIDDDDDDEKKKEK